MAGATKPGPVQLVRAVDSFHGPAGLFVAVDSIYSADAPVVAAYPQFFEPFEPKAD